MDIIQVITRELKVEKWQVEAAVKLIDEGCTIPFISRYRKEATGSLNDEQLRTLHERLTYLRNLEDKKNQVLGSIEEQGKLTPELKKQILDAQTLVVVEDLYRPYRPKRRTRAIIAKEKGLEPLANIIMLQMTNKSLEEEAKAFFEEMSSLYKDYDNVIYEICNEPNGGTTWADVKSYAEEVIPIIRKNTKDALIIVGTPTWSQDVDIAAEDPVTGYDNIMYAVHFYAATHTDNIRNKVTTALSKGLPIFVSEFSICDASGNGAIDYDQAAKWFDLIDSNNLSYAAWNLSNKAETSSLIDSSCTKTSGWTDEDYSETGKWLKKQMHGEN